MYADTVSISNSGPRSPSSRLDPNALPIADILGRDRRPLIAAARHEAIWRVRRVTGWSLPRLGRFFKRDHTTVLHSVREMEKRSAHDPELRAYMIALSLPRATAAPHPPQSPPISCSLLRLRDDGANRKWEELRRGGAAVARGNDKAIM